MNVTTNTTIRLGAEPVTRAGWRCPSCGTNYSPDVTACHCSPVMTTSACPGTFPVLPPYQVTCTCPQAWGGLTPPPACPAHGQTEMIRVTC